MMEPGNRGWPSSWSRWWPWWLWRAEDHTSQGALGRDPIRNRAVPERRPVPISPRPSWLPPAAFQRWLLPWPFFCFLLPKNIFSSSSTLLHKLVSEKTNLKGGSGLRSASSTVQCGGVPHLYHRERLRGECLKGGHIGKLQSPCRKKRGGKNFMLPSRIYTDR